MLFPGFLFLVYTGVDELVFKVRAQYKMTCPQSNIVAACISALNPNGVDRVLRIKLLIAPLQRCPKSFNPKQTFFSEQRIIYPTFGLVYIFFFKALDRPIFKNYRALIHLPVWKSLWLSSSIMFLFSPYQELKYLA